MHFWDTCVYWDPFLRLYSLLKIPLLTLKVQFLWGTCSLTLLTMTSYLDKLVFSYSGLGKLFAHPWRKPLYGVLQGSRFLAPVPSVTVSEHFMFFMTFSVLKITPFWFRRMQISLHLDRRNNLLMIFCLLSENLLLVVLSTFSEAYLKELGQWSFFLIQEFDW